MNQSEAFTLMEEYFRSGINGAEFYRSKNMTEWQFYKWKQRYLDAHPEKRVPDNRPAKKPLLFQPVTVVGKPSCPAPQFEIVYPGGVILRVVEGAADIQLLRELVNL